MRPQSSNRMEWWWILGELSLAGMGCLQWGEGRDKRRKRSLGEDWKEERMQEKGVEVLRVMGDVAYAAICGLRSLQIPLATACTSKYSTRAASNTN